MVTIICWWRAWEDINQQVPYSRHYSLLCSLDGWTLRRANKWDSKSNAQRRNHSWLAALVHHLDTLLSLFFIGSSNYISIVCSSMNFVIILDSPVITSRGMWCSKACMSSYRIRLCPPLESFNTLAAMDALKRSSIARTQYPDLQEKPHTWGENALSCSRIGIFEARS